MTQAEFYNVVDTMVNASPTGVYKRMKVYFGTEFRANWQSGFETVDSSKEYMKNYLKRAGDAAKDYGKFIIQFVGQ